MRFEHSTLKTARAPPRADYTAAVGSDSFLDVVTNIVGILIILVMVVGMCSRNAAGTRTNVGGRR